MFKYKPILVIIAQGEQDYSGSAAVFISPAISAIANNRGGGYSVYDLQWGNNFIKWYATNTARSASDQYNWDGKLYLYVAFSL